MLAELDIADLTCQVSLSVKNILVALEAWLLSPKEFLRILHAALKRHIPDRVYHCRVLATGTCYTNSKLVGFREFRCLKTASCTACLLPSLTIVHLDTPKSYFADLLRYTYHQNQPKARVKVLMAASSRVPSSCLCLQSQSSNFFLLRTVRCFVAPAAPHWPCHRIDHGRQSAPPANCRAGALIPKHPSHLTIFSRSVSQSRPYNTLRYAELGIELLSACHLEACVLAPSPLVAASSAMTTLRKVADCRDTPGEKNEMIVHTYRWWLQVDHTISGLKEDLNENVWGIGGTGRPEKVTMAEINVAAWVVVGA